MDAAALLEDAAARQKGLRAAVRADQLRKAGRRSDKQSWRGDMCGVRPASARLRSLGRRAGGAGQQLVSICTPKPWVDEQMVMSVFWKTGTSINLQHSSREVRGTKPWLV